MTNWWRTATARRSCRHFAGIESLRRTWIAPRPGLLSPGARGLDIAVTASAWRWSRSGSLDQRHFEQSVRLRKPASKEHVRYTVSTSAGVLDELELNQASQRFLDDLRVTELKLVAKFLLIYAMICGCGRKRTEYTPPCGAERFPDKDKPRGFSGDDIAERPLDCLGRRRAPLGDRARPRKMRQLLRCRWGGRQ